MNNQYDEELLKYIINDPELADVIMQKDISFKKLLLNLFRSVENGQTTVNYWLKFIDYLENKQ